MLSDVFGEQVKKSNLESVLERQINVKITFGNKNTRNKNAVNIASLKNCPVPSTANPKKSKPATPDSQQQSQNQTKIETIDKLRNFGLSYEQIAEALEIPLDVVNQLSLND